MLARVERNKVSGKSLGRSMECLGVRKNSGLRSLRRKAEMELRGYTRSSELERNVIPDCILKAGSLMTL